MRFNKASVYLNNNVHLIEPFLNELPERSLHGWPTDWQKYFQPLFRDKRIETLMNHVRAEAGYSTKSDCTFQIIQFIKATHNDKFRN